VRPLNLGPNKTTVFKLEYHTRSSSEPAMTDTPAASAYPTWFGILATVSVTTAIGGFLAGVLVPGPISGAFFPIGMFGIWLTSKLFRSKATGQ
jgi:hypothetical protein